MNQRRSATARMEAARRNRQKVLNERQMLISLLSRLWPSHLSEAQRPNAIAQSVVCIHSPAGQLAWLVSDEELPLFDHLERTAGDWDGHTSADRYARLDVLINDWYRPKNFVKSAKLREVRKRTNATD